MQFQVKEPEKKFKPVTAELTFESQEELNWFYWITNMSYSVVEKSNGVSISNDKYCDVQMNLYNFAEKLHKQYSI